MSFLVIPFYAHTLRQKEKKRKESRFLYETQGEKKLLVMFKSRIMIKANGIITPNNNL